MLQGSINMTIRSIKSKCFHSFQSFKFLLTLGLLAVGVVGIGSPVKAFADPIFRDQLIEHYLRTGRYTIPVRPDFSIPNYLEKLESLIEETSKQSNLAADVKEEYLRVLSGYKNYATAFLASDDPALQASKIWDELFTYFGFLLQSYYFESREVVFLESGADSQSHQVALKKALENLLSFENNVEGYLAELEARLAKDFLNAPALARQIKEKNIETHRALFAMLKVQISLDPDLLADPLLGFEMTGIHNDGLVSLTEPQSLIAYLDRPTFRSESLRSLYKKAKFQIEKPEAMQFFDRETRQYLPLPRASISLQERFQRNRYSLLFQYDSLVEGFNPRMNFGLSRPLGRGIDDKRFTGFYLKVEKAIKHFLFAKHSHEMAFHFSGQPYFLEWLKMFLSTDVLPENLEEAVQIFSKVLVNDNERLHIIQGLSQRFFYLDSQLEDSLALSQKLVGLISQQLSTFTDHSAFEAFEKSLNRTFLNDILHINTLPIYFQYVSRLFILETQIPFTNQPRFQAAEIKARRKFLTRLQNAISEPKFFGYNTKAINPHLAANTNHEKWKALLNAINERLDKPNTVPQFAQQTLFQTGTIEKLVQNLAKNCD